MGFSMSMGMRLGARRSSGAAALLNPTGFSVTLPLAITRTAPQTYVTDLDAETRKVASSVTYYFDPVTGSGMNDGLSAENPKNSLGNLIDVLNASPPAGGATFILAPGYYSGSAGFAGKNIGFDLNVICPDGRAEFSFRDAFTWSKTAGRTNVWQSATSRTAQAVVDLADLDAFGIERRLTNAADVAAVDATAGSMFISGGVLYVHTHDGREPDSDIIGLSPSIKAWDQTLAHNFYLENIDFWGYGEPVYLNAAGLNATFVSCSFRYSAESEDGLKVDNALTSSDLIICVDCDASYNAYDGFNYNGSALCIEIGCKGVWNGYTNTNANDNGSTGHDDATVVRIMGVYRFNADRNIHDIESVHSWNVGCAIGDAQNGEVSGYNSAGVLSGRTSADDAARVYLEDCTFTGGSAADIGAYRTAATYIYAPEGLGAAILDGDGTFEMNDVDRWPGRVGWTPAALFSNGEPGGAWNTQDISFLKLVDGNPVTTDSQFVGQILPEAGSQILFNISAAEVPRYIAATGLLAFDGANDSYEMTPASRTADMYVAGLVRGADDYWELISQVPYVNAYVTSSGLSGLAASGVGTPTLLVDTVEIADLANTLRLATNDNTLHLVECFGMDLSGANWADMRMFASGSGTGSYCFAGHGTPLFFGPTPSLGNLARLRALWLSRWSSHGLSY